VQTLRDRILTLKESAVLSTVPGSGSSTRLTGRTSVSCKPGMRMVLVLGVSAGFHNRMIHPSRGVKKLKRRQSSFAIRF